MEVIVSTIGSVIVALLGLVAARQARQTKKLQEVHAQVQNTHETNLREDLDRMLGVLHDVRDDVLDLKEDVLNQRDRLNTHLAADHG